MQALFILALLNLTKHPLSSFPGPRLWACSRVPYIFYLQNGTLPTKIKALHDYYGLVVRVAPNELSFISPEAWKDIYCDRPYGLEVDEKFYGMLGQDALIGAGHKDRARMRGAISPAFRASAMRGHEEKLRKYARLLVEHLGVLAKN